MFKIFMVELSGFNYVSGQGGTPVLLDNLSYVEEAAVENVIGTIGEEAIVGQIVEKGLTSPALYNGDATIEPVSNEVVMTLSNISSGTLSEIASGVVSGTIILLVQGY